MRAFTAKPLLLLRWSLPVFRAGACLLGALLLAFTFCASIPCAAQVFTVEREHVAGPVANLTVLQPTRVPLQNVPLTRQTREELIRLFQSEQAFAVRPLPLGHRGLILHANGSLSPEGSGYVDELEKEGISAKPGDRLIISKFEIGPDRMIFEFNGGPDRHHRLLQHIQVGGDIGMMPLAQDTDAPIGSRFTLLFAKFVPEMNAAQLRALISPILDFSLKTPAQAYADTLPPKLKHAVLDHQVLVGMDRDMVVHAMGLPEQKVRETENNTPFEEWIYGHPPHEVQFVRFVGNRVTRLEIADIGQPLIIRDKDETGGYFAGQFVHEVRLGDAPPVGPNQEHGPQAAPTLRAPGEKLPNAANQDQQLKPVQFPKDGDDQKKAEPPPIPPPPGQSAEDDLPVQSPPPSPGAQR